MKECMFYEHKQGDTVQCHLCPRKCIIKEGARGNCRVRENQKGKLVSLVYAKPCGVSIDPIEKKPLYHFLPGSPIYSFGTAGCNLHCSYCQNWKTSQASPEEVTFVDLSPEKAVLDAMHHDCRSIAYTYNEPIVFYEYVLDCIKEARKKGLKNVIVCNGFINEEPLLEWCKYIDAANIDLKAFSEEFYKEYTGSSLKPVLRTLKILKEQGVWLEITNLLIPGANDDMEEIREMCEWIKDNLGDDVPLHFTAFHPCYKLLDRLATQKSTLVAAKKVAVDVGLKYVYIGNVSLDKDNDTYCPKCGELLIERGIFDVAMNNIVDGRCICGYEVSGEW